MIVSAIKRYQEMGATHFTFDVTPETLDKALYTMERFVNEIRPKL